jgi:hypothetical protein
MSDLTTEDIELFRVPPEYADLLLIKGVFTFQDPLSRLVYVRTKADYRNRLTVMVVNSRPELRDNASEIATVMSDQFPVDAWDSGIQYLVTEVDGVKSAQIVAKIDSYTPKIVVQPTLMRDKLNHMLSINADTRFRVWEEGTVVTVKTVVVGGERKTFYSTRNKIDAFNSKWTAGSDSPMIMDEFFKACASQGITTKSIEIEGLCFAFILQSQWNTTKQKTDKPRVILFRTYEFGNGDYKEISRSVHGAIPVREMNIDQAIEYMNADNGGVIITMFPFNNKKFMSTDTELVYSWFEGRNSTQPALQYFQLLANNRLTAQRYQEMLNTHMRASLDRTLDNLDANIISTAEYIKYCLGQAIKEKVPQPTRRNDEKQAPKKKSMKTFRDSNDIMFVIRRAMREYKILLDAAIGAKDKKQTPAKGKKPQKGKKQPKVQFDQLEFIVTYLNKLRTDDAVKLIKLINVCARLNKSDLARLRAQQARDNEASRPVTPTFGSKAKSELFSAIQFLEQNNIISDDMMFIPGQMDTDEEFDRWVVIDDPKSPTTFSDDE